MDKTAFKFLLIFAILAVAISGQAQNDQSTASASTITATTTGSSTVSTTITTTATGVTLYEADPSLFPIGKAHIKIAKQSNKPNECVYIITIEDGDILSPLVPGFTPKDIVATFSVNNNVYIKYDNMKVEYSFYDKNTGKSNYVPYNPTPCASNAKDFITAVVGTIPGPDVLYGVYDIFRSGGELIGCLSYLYDWRAEVTVNGNEVKNKDDYQSQKVDKNYFFEKIMGVTERDRNDRRVETITYSEDPSLELNIPPRSVVITIPVQAKDIAADSDFRFWIDIRAYSSTGAILSNSIDQGKSNALNTGTSLMTKSLGLYFENDNLFQKGQKDVSKTAEGPTNVDLHPPVLSDAKVNRDCGSESDPFTFSVIYRDEDGDEAKDAYVRIIGFDGTNKIYDTQDDINLGKMVKGPGELSSGVQYTYTTTLHAAPECYYRFYFSNQKGSKAYLPDNKTSLGFTGPRVGAGCQEKEVKFPDPNLEAAIRVAINKPEGSIYSTDLEGLKRLDVSDKNIKNIIGLEYCNNLEELVLSKKIILLSSTTGIPISETSDNRITNVSPLSGLTNLKALKANGNQITDISPLCGLNNLQELWLSYNQITDVAPLSKLRNLRVLNLSNNQITDTSPLSGFRKLKYLEIDGNLIKDISPLSGLTSLEELNLYDNQIIDISPLSGLRNLRDLVLMVNQITDLSPLSGLANLMDLSLTSNQITDLSPLSGLTNLKTLTLAFNQITDVSSLSRLINLDSLVLGGNQITDLSTLSGLTNLRVLTLNDNRIKDISWLSAFTNLEWLYIWNNQITDISPLSGLRKLKYLEIDRNLIKDISPLSGLTSLEELNLKHNQITDLSPLSSLINLESLVVSDNPIRDISPLSGLTKLEVLRISNNQIDVSPLSSLINLRVHYD